MNQGKRNITVETIDRVERENVHTEIVHGDYFRFVPTEETYLSKTFVENELYITTQTHYHHLTKELHNLALFIPAHLGGSSTTPEFKLSFKDFEPHFIYVPQDQAETEREETKRLITNQINEIRGELNESLSKPETIYQKILESQHSSLVEARGKIDTSVPLLLESKHQKASSTDIVPLIDGKTAETVKRQLMNQKALGEVISIYSEVKSDELKTVVNHGTSIAMEAAYATMGQAKQMSESVQDVMDKVEMLNLYLGEKVTIWTIIDKPESTSCEKIHFFSNKIYCDEEMLTDSIFSDHSFDHQDIDQFFTRLQESPSFLNRILPMERSVVCFQYRRTQKHYHDEGFANSILNLPNFKVGLLVRDGERVSCILSPVDFQARLFPTQREMDDYLNHISDIDDVALTDAQKNLKYLNTTYSMVASIFQGIIDRQLDGETIVFGELAYDQHGASFFNPDAVRRNVEFINDEDNLIGQNPITENPNNWLKQHLTTDHTEGDLVLFQSSLVNYDNASGCYKFSQAKHDYQVPERVYRPDERCSILTVGTYKQKLALKIPTTYDGYSFKLEGKTKNVWLNLNDPSTEEAYNLRNIKFSELKTLIESRVARPKITDEMEGLVCLFDFFKKLDSDTKPVQDYISQNSDCKDNDSQILNIIKWLKVNPKKEKLLKDKPYLAAKAIVNLIESNTELSENQIMMIDEQCGQLGIKPLFIASDFNELYLVSHQSNANGIPYITLANDDVNNITAPDLCDIYAVKQDSLVLMGNLTTEMNKLTIKHVFTREYEHLITPESIASKLKDLNRRSHMMRATDHVIEKTEQDAYQFYIESFKDRIRSKYAKLNLIEECKVINTLDRYKLSEDVTETLNTTLKALFGTVDEKVAAIKSIMKSMKSNPDYVKYNQGYLKAKQVEIPHRLLVTRLEQHRFMSKSKTLTYACGYAYSPLKCAIYIYRTMTNIEQFQHKAMMLDVIQQTTRCKDDYANEFLERDPIAALEPMEVPLVELPKPWCHGQSMLYSISESERKSETLITNGLPREWVELLKEV